MEVAGRQQTQGGWRGGLRSGLILEVHGLEHHKRSIPHLRAGSGSRVRRVIPPWRYIGRTATLAPALSKSRPHLGCALAALRECGDTRCEQLLRLHV